jgi:endonuclease/exonuclease/phosphatase family metal-dependent hydrolase
VRAKAPHFTLLSTEFRIFGLHLSAVHSSWAEGRRIREIVALLEGIKRHQEGFHALVGDFNTLAPGETLEARLLPARLRALRWLGGAIQWQTIQILFSAGYVDGYRLLHPLKKGFTFPTYAPHVRLDYVFQPAAFADRLKTCEVIQGSAAAIEASDHFPILARLEI